MSVNFRLDFIGVLFSFLGAHAIELNIYMSHYHRLFTPSKRHKEISFCSGSAGNIREDHNSLSWWRKKVIKEKKQISESVTRKRLKRLIGAGKLSALTGTFQIHEVLIGSDLCKEETYPHSDTFLTSRRAGESHKLSLLWNMMKTWNKSVLNTCKIILFFHLALLHTSRTLIHRCYITTSPQTRLRKRFQA